MRVLEVHALADAAKLDLLVALHRLERHLPTAVAEGVIDLAEPAATNRVLDRIALERAFSMLVLISLHSSAIPISHPVYWTLETFTTSSSKPD